MNKDLVFYDMIMDVDHPHYNPTYKLSEKQQVFLRWYALARMEKLVNGHTQTDIILDKIILKKEYTSNNKPLLNTLREKYTIQYLKQLVEDSIKSGRIGNTVL